MQNSSSSARDEALEKALYHLETGLKLLDSANAAAHIGAHVDLAIHQLRADLQGGLMVENVQQISS